MKKLAIGLTYDLKTDYIPDVDDPKDVSAEFDPPRVVEILEEALKTLGHEVIRIGNARQVLDNIKDIKVDIVFNIAEGLKGRNRESQVPIILEMMDIPFVGADGLTLGLTLDKVLAKKVFLTENLLTPKYFEADTLDKIDGKCMNYPLIVKPKFEGSSKGIDDDSLVRDPASMRKQIEKIINVYDEPALVEEFIEGKELTAALLGNEDPEVLPLVQVKIDDKLDLGELFYTYERINSDKLQYVCPAQISRELTEKINDIAVAAYKAVGCKDFGRVDFRIDNQGNPYVLEVNPLPCLAIDDAYGVTAKVLGISFEDMINRILTEALKRYRMI
jgi:D-alanine-D-alanine ligase